MEKINIITRTSGRPNTFDRCYRSIKNQTYKNINHIVLYDDYRSKEYLDQYEDIDAVLVDRDYLINTQTNRRLENLMIFKWAPHNLYNNIGLERLKEGFYMFLDDDDYLRNNFVIQQLVNELEDRDTLYVFQMDFNGVKVPSDDMIDRRKIELFNIGSPCYLIPVKYKDSAFWDAFKCADYRYVRDISNVIPKTKFIKNIVAKIDMIGDGMKRDVA